MAGRAQNWLSGNPPPLLFCSLNWPMAFACPFSIRPHCRSYKRQTEHIFVVYYPMGILCQCIDVVYRRLRMSQQAKTASQSPWPCSHGARATSSSRFLDDIQDVKGTRDVPLPFSWWNTLVDAVLCDSSTSVHLSDAVCDINGDFFCRRPLSVPFSLLKSLVQWTELLGNIQRSSYWH